MHTNAVTHSHLGGSMTTTDNSSGHDGGRDTASRASDDRADATHRPELTSLAGALGNSHDPAYPSDVLFASLSEINGVTALCVRGEIDATSLASLGAHLQDISDEGRPFVIDCTNCHFRSTAELSILSALAARVNRLGITWALATDHRTIRLLELMEFDTRIDVFSSLSEAGAFVSASATERTSS
ncbi:anti-sigma factor antagonist [Rhodococcus sp. AD45-ID]|nr:Anti-anti-sigma regulatory factor (antagonist of anti-sigma factor) [Rhodococcus sp. AD45]NRI67131.1 STAS domain-containing protein [Rhodococcus sp. MS16]PSR42041.1 anti-sigma factor antagonist [Rhodococcus sp. AD45-ID]ROZ49809.1 anti-sigma factor antagonist [Rhodococcus sp. WS3]RZL26302.1 MAG: anti-sigma factor antagonist [Rhodococcus sp. (in: high G+C Gram-positive bacteria)]